MLAIEDNKYSQDLHQLGKRLGKPDAIVVFTAHWVSAVQTVTSTDEPQQTVYDFGGFSPKLYEIKYPARGSVQVANEVTSLLEQSGFMVNTSSHRGLDHGVWVILHHMFPDADIPVVSASVNSMLEPEDQYRIGKALTELKDKNVVIIGSGGTVHNFNTMDLSFEGPEIDAWAEEFDTWLIEHMQKWDTAALFDYRQQGRHAELATPDYEHFLPLFIAMGAGDDKREVHVVHRSYRYKNLSHMIVEFE